MFQLTREEFDSLRSQFVISKGSGGRRYLPYAFTEHGAIMAANVLNNEQAIRASVSGCACVREIESNSFLKRRTCAQS